VYADWVEARALRCRPEDYVDYPVPERDAETDRRWWAEGVGSGRCWMWGIWLKAPKGDGPGTGAKASAQPLALIGLLSAFGFNASGEAEIGIELLHPCWMRQGYGKEALEAWCRHLQAQQRSVLKALVHPGNVPSLGLFRAAGFQDLGSIRDVQEPDWTFRHFRKVSVAEAEAPE
jgi:RimJ/RimL family protein N-acetyltransferase